MCCFSRQVRFVGGTRIFARRIDEGRQFLAYAMNVEIDEALAMVLPLPVPSGVTEDAVKFVDLSAYPKFFDELDSAFEPIVLPAKRAFGPPTRGQAEQKLVVHRVGSFIASFVPSRGDFARLDPRLRLPESVFDSVRGYDDFGFAVFRLEPVRRRLGLGERRQTIHPMAFSFPTREPDSLFFPTLHVHDGTVPASADFDHTFYYQDVGLLCATLPWHRSRGRLGEKVDCMRASGLVLGDRDGFQAPLHGRLPNTDTVLTPPRGVSLAELAGQGECFAFELGAQAHYGAYAHRPASARWKRNASVHLGLLSKGLREGLDQLQRDARERYRLAPLSADLPPHFMNGPHLWTGMNYRNGQPVTELGPGRVEFKEFTERVEPQTIRLGFERVPDPATLERLRAELREILDRSIPG